MPPLTHKQKGMRLFSGLLVLVTLHFILYALEGGKHGYQDESFVVSAYATAMLAAAELGLVSVKNVLGRIGCFLLLGPYLFVMSVAVAVARSGWNHSEAYTGGEVSSGYHDYLAVFPFAVSVVLFLGLIRVMGYLWPFLSND